MLGFLSLAVAASLGVEALQAQNQLPANLGPPPLPLPAPKVARPIPEPPPARQEAPVMSQDMPQPRDGFENTRWKVCSNLHVSKIDGLTSFGLSRAIAGKAPTVPACQQDQTEGRTLALFGMGRAQYGNSGNWGWHVEGGNLVLLAPEHNKKGKLVDYLRVDLAPVSGGLKGNVIISRSGEKRGETMWDWIAVPLR
jgi:hypothetical protein